MTYGFDSEKSTGTIGEEFAQIGRVRAKQHERGERGRADRIALRDRLGRVADRVERVGAVADIVGQARHLGDPARALSVTGP